MSVVKAISNSELAALANRLRLTLIRDRMEEMLGLAAEKDSRLVRLWNFSFDRKLCAEKKTESDKESWGLIFQP